MQDFTRDPDGELNHFGLHMAKVILTIARKTLHRLGQDLALGGYLPLESGSGLRFTLPDPNRAGFLFLRSHFVFVKGSSLRRPRFTSGLRVSIGIRGSRVSVSASLLCSFTHRVQHGTIDIRLNCGRHNFVNRNLGPRPHRHLLHYSSRQSCRLPRACASNSQSPVALAAPDRNERGRELRCPLSTFPRRAKTWICRSDFSNPRMRPSGPSPMFFYLPGPAPHEWRPPEPCSGLQKQTSGPGWPATVWGLAAQCWRGSDRCISGPH